ncbi:hypothetical protein L227DRAFT_393757 [Lentinus tigrinus ALCF2SS1-6]|uniref:Uncharacterized protein n=1 Tax=Lentinus tigrinus ALCF2SS1-6 TaxID=1328759 RepID=A0A5C2SIH5_9APHY|nr:hypothetical protein L227DRAFT_393757 [Lentinus tigrinus ALCF2SS1-6]
MTAHHPIRMHPSSIAVFLHVPCSTIPLRPHATCLPRISGGTSPLSRFYRLKDCFSRPRHTHDRCIRTHYPLLHAQRTTHHASCTRASLITFITISSSLDSLRAPPRLSYTYTYLLRFMPAHGLLAWNGLCSLFLCVFSSITICPCPRSRSSPTSRLSPSPPSPPSTPAPTTRGTYRPALLPLPYHDELCVHTGSPAVPSLYLVPRLPSPVCVAHLCRLHISITIPPVDTSLVCCSLLLYRGPNVLCRQL